MDRPYRFSEFVRWSLPLLAAFGIAVATTPVSAQGVVRSVHDDWQIRCETPPGAQNEQCALFQSVVAEDRANVGITVVVIKTADQKARLMRIQAPLGVLLPPGLGLKIDQTDVGRVTFMRCLLKGCYAEVVMDDELLKKMRSGTTATFFIFQNSGGRDRFSHEPQRLWRRLRQAPLNPSVLLRKPTPDFQALARLYCLQTN